MLTQQRSDELRRVIQQQIRSRWSFVTSLYGDSAYSREENHELVRISSWG